MFVCLSNISVWSEGRKNEERKGENKKDGVPAKPMDLLADGWRLRPKINKKFTERWVFRHDWFLDVPVEAAQSLRPGEDVH